LTKSEINTTQFPLTESLSRWPADEREDEKPWLFETLAYNPPREPEKRRNLLFFRPATH
jgi:hypothetical protein